MYSFSQIRIHDEFIGNVLLKYCEKGGPMKFKFFLPLIMLLVPTIVISSFLLQKHADDTMLIGGFVLLMIATSFSYYLGVRHVVKEYAVKE